MELLAKIMDAVTRGEPVIELVEEAFATVEAESILSEAVVPGIERAGEFWQEGEYFLPDVILASESFKEAMSILEPRLAVESTAGSGVFMIGVVEGDMHDLGKSIVITMLTAGGFEVIDLGANVPVHVFVEKVREHRPDILGIGAYMSTTMLIMKDVIAALEEADLRREVKVMVGGVPVTPQWASDIGADGFGRDAMEALANARGLMEAGS